MHPNYNNLRLDALHLGQAAADAVNIAALLERYETRLTVVRLNTTQLRVTATATTPVSLLIAGYMCQAVANVDLAIGDAPSGAAATYYVFAERVGASTSFVLKVSTISVENAGQRRIGVFYWDGTAIVKDSIITELAQHITSLLSFKESHLCEGRLTLSTGVPVSNLDVASSSIVYFTPYGGNRISLYVPGYGWRHYTFAELILDISLFASSRTSMFLFTTMPARSHSQLPSGPMPPCEQPRLHIKTAFWSNRVAHAALFGHFLYAWRGRHQRHQQCQAALE